MTDTEELERLAASITPKDWRVENRGQDDLNAPRYNNGPYLVLSDDCEYHAVADCSCTSSCRLDFELEANARAIALLPELLKENIDLRAEVERLQARATAAEADAERLAAYLRWQIKEGGTFHPTAPSALAAHTQRVNASKGSDQ